MSDSEYSEHISGFEQQLAADIKQAIDYLREGETVEASNRFRGTGIPESGRKALLDYLTGSINVVLNHDDPNKRPSFHVERMLALFGSKRQFPELLSDFHFDKLEETLDARHPMADFETDAEQSMAYRTNDIALAMVSGTHAKYAFVSLVGGLLSALHESRKDYADLHAMYTELANDDPIKVEALHHIQRQARLQGMREAERVVRRMARSGRHVSATEAEAALNDYIHSSGQEVPPRIVDAPAKETSAHDNQSAAVETRYQLLMLDTGGWVKLKNTQYEAKVLRPDATVFRNRQEAETHADILRTQGYRIELVETSAE